MSVSKSIERLARIRGLEEEERRLKLEEAAARLQSLKHARTEAIEKERLGRAGIAASAATGELNDRVAGLVESDIARTRTRMLNSRIAVAENETAARLREFLEKFSDSAGKRGREHRGRRGKGFRTYQLLGCGLTSGGS